MSILHPNHVTAFALAAVVARRLPSLLAAIEVGRRTRTSLRSFPSSSCSRRTPTLSHRYHLSLEESPCRREPQPPSAETFASLGEHPHDPPPLCYFSIAFGAPERPGCRAPVSCPLGYGAAEFPQSCRRRHQPELPWAVHALIDDQDLNVKYPFTFLISAVDLRTDDSHLTRVSGLVD
jgi:hypothetical protein